MGFVRKGLSWLNVLSVYTFDDQGVRQYTDYWCDICSIPMYQIQPCVCCQGPLRLRFQPLDLPANVKPAPALTSNAGNASNSTAGNSSAGGKER